jgi:uncharacterized protein
MKHLTLLFLLSLPCLLISQEQNHKLVEAAKHEMKTYYLVFLKKGPDRTQDSVAVEKLQTQHLAHLTKMYNEGKMDVCGPLLDDGDIRGICIYNVATKEEALQLANEDPMIKAGRLVAEIHPFYSAKGVSLK